MHHCAVISDSVFTSEARMICTSSAPHNQPSQRYTQYPPFRPHKTFHLVYTQRISDLELMIIIVPLPIFSTQTSRNSHHKEHSNILYIHFTTQPYVVPQQPSLMQLQNNSPSCSLETIDQNTSLTFPQSHHCANATEHAESINSYHTFVYPSEHKSKYSRISFWRYRGKSNICTGLADVPR
jgi:hypothetical protein